LSVVRSRRLVTALRSDQLWAQGHFSRSMCLRRRRTAPIGLFELGRAASSEERNVVEHSSRVSPLLSFHRKRARSFHNCGCHDPASKQRARPAKRPWTVRHFLGIGKTVLVEIIELLPRIFSSAERPAARQPTALSKHRQEPRPPYWCEYRAIPAAAAAPSPQRRHC